MSRRGGKVDIGEICLFTKEQGNKSRRKKTFGKETGSRTEVRGIGLPSQRKGDIRGGGGGGGFLSIDPSNKKEGNFLGEKTGGIGWVLEPSRRRREAAKSENCLLYGSKHRPRVGQIVF